jgi:hypothetical protein
MQDSNDNMVYIFGDSHSVIFVGAEGKFKACVCGLDGASLSGLNNKNSNLEYGKYIIDTMNNRPKSYYILLKLGQVDMEFIIYYKLYFKNESFTFEMFCKSLIDKYREFIIKLLEINRNVIIASINLPSYHDHIDIRNYITRIITPATENYTEDKLLGDITKDPKLTTFSLIQLTENFRYFNGLLSALAKEMGVLLFDTTAIFIDPDTKLLKNKYRDYGHHYNGYYDSTIDTRSITHDFFHRFFEQQYL